MHKFNNTILYIPAFNKSIDKRRHGGLRRSEQLDQIFRKHANVITFDACSIFKFCLIYRILFRLIFPINSGLSLKGRIQESICISSFEHFLKTNKISLKKVTTFIDMAPRSTIFLPAYFIKNQWDYSLVNHNIEFLVANQIIDKFKPGYLFTTETRAIKFAKKCIAISDFDLSILSIFTPRCECLPYYPICEDINRFGHISQQRKKSTKEGFLIIGTARNPPTRQGMECLISEFLKLSSCDFEISIVGFGTEIFKNYETGTIKVLGGISDEELEKCLIQTKAVILYQVPTSGFLTRIVEFNLAGVPIFINGSYVQAQNLNEYAIFTYNRLEDVFQRDTSGDFVRYAMPEPDLSFLLE